MSEKQLTVAELLARSGKKPADSSRRRRRRSIEEGGISVAELTGNIPKVEAKPATGKHNSDSIDNPAAPKPVSASKPADAPEQKTDVAKQPQSYATPASAKPEVKTPETTAESKPEIKEPSNVKAPAAPKPAEAKKDESSKPADATAVAASPKAPAKPEVKRAEPDAKTATPATDETVVLSVVDEKDPVRLTTGTFPAVSKEQAEKAAEKDAQSQKTAVASPAKPQADEVKKATETKPEASKEAPKGTAAKAGLAGAGTTAAATAGAATKDTEQTNVIPAVKDEDLKPESKDAAEAKFATDEELTDEELAAELDAEDAEYDEDEDVEYVEEDAEYDDEEWDEEYDEDEEWDEDESVSVPAIIGMAIAGIVLGVLVFKGFEMLWGSMNKGIVTALALAVTAVMVGVVHALRTNRDRLSMLLAVVVGLIMTFGPLLTIS